MCEYGYSRTRRMDRHRLRGVGWWRGFGKGMDWTRSERERKKNESKWKRRVGGSVRERRKERKRKEERMKR